MYCCNTCEKSCRKKNTVKRECENQSFNHAAGKEFLRQLLKNKKEGVVKPIIIGGCCYAQNA